MIRFELKMFKVVVWKCRRLWSYTGGADVKQLGLTGKGARTMGTGPVKAGGREYGIDGTFISRCVWYRKPPRWGWHLSCGGSQKPCRPSRLCAP